jgi:hypothetical protein
MSAAAGMRAGKAGCVAFKRSDIIAILPIELKTVE